MTANKHKSFPLLVTQAKSSGKTNDDDIKQMAAELLFHMTLADKIGQMSGNATLLDIAIMLVRYNLKTYDSGKNSHLGIPAIKFTDGPRGITVGNSTCFPVSMARGATWDPALEERVGNVMGIEARAQGANFFGGVCVNVLRHPGWGRAQETFGEDSFLLGEMGAAAIRGVKQHAMTCVKHFVCNSIEESRFYVDVKINEQVLREVYLPHFKKCIEAGATSVMSAYNRVNGEYCGHNRHLLTDILKDEWGFNGFVMSDFCYGVYDAKKGVTAGMDLEMPETKRYGKKLKQVVEQGEIPIEAIDQAVSRILCAKLRFVLMASPVTYTKDKIACPEHTRLAYEVACKSMVLLKNDNQILPLDRAKIKKIAVLGRLAGKKNLGDMGSSCVRPPYTVTPLDGIKNRAGKDVTVLSYTGKDPTRAAHTAAEADVTVIATGLTSRQEGEYFPRIRGGDRTYLGLPEQDIKLIKAVCAQGSNCIVVLEGGSVITMEEWKDDVSAILMAWYPGMEGGHALADILFGDVNPCGRLPITFFASEDQLFAFDKRARTVDYDLYHGYRYVDQKGIVPAFYFGFGLSYTKYVYNDLKLSADTLTEEETLEARVNVTNTGEIVGDETVQLYAGFKKSAHDRAVKELKAFKRVSLDPGESRQVKLIVPLKDLAFYHAGHQQWEVEKGEYTVWVGPSSNPSDLKLSQTFVVS